MSDNQLPSALQQALPPELAALLPAGYTSTSRRALSNSELLAFAEGVRRLALNEAFDPDAPEYRFNQPRWRKNQNEKC